MDVLLKGKIDLPALVFDERSLLDLADLLPRHPLAKPRLDPGMFEMKEMSRVVPRESTPPDRLAVAADLLVCLQDQVVAVDERSSRREPGNTGAHYQGADGVHEPNILRKSEIAHRPK